MDFIYRFDLSSSSSSKAVAKSVFTCNRYEISSRDETRPGMKKFLFPREFHHRMKLVEFYPGMKINLKENLPLSIKFIV